VASWVVRVSSCSQSITQVRDIENEHRKLALAAKAGRPHVRRQQAWIVGRRRQAPRSGMNLPFSVSSDIDAGTNPQLVGSLAA
jgi:hypothetical protein